MLASFLVALPFLVLATVWTIGRLVVWLMTPRKQVSRAPNGRGARVYAPVEITRITRPGGGF